MAESARPDDMLSLGQVQQIYGVKRATLYRYVQRGKLKTYRRGMDRRAYVRRGDVENLRQFSPGKPSTGFNLASLERARAFQREVFGERVLTTSTAEIIEESRSPRVDPGLAGRVVFITGANHGIGAATARAFARQAAKVFITYHHPPTRYSPEELRAAAAAGIGGDPLYRARQQQSVGPLLDEIRSGGGVAVAREADLADPDDVPRLFDRCEAELGPVDVLVCNHTHCALETFDPARVTTEGAGIFLTTAAGIDAHFAVNARAVALLMAEYLRRYLGRQAIWGRIINLSTDAAHAHPANVSYAASKHAIESYSRSAAAEMGKYGITVNVVAPGPIQTGYVTPESEARIAQETPLRRVGRPEDVADVIVFLASEQARWLTGQLLYIGGGWRMPQ